MKLFFLLLGLWLVLNESLWLGHVLLGAALALAGVLVFARLEPPATLMRSHPGVVLRLIGRLFADIARSNFAVACIVLGLHAKQRNAGFLTLPLELRHPAGLAVIACIITATPGTSWVRYDGAQNIVTIHVLDLVDDAAWIRSFKERYERLLMEIFE
jgi:multicomponent K+:H+ antiporter subunit E